MLFATLSPQRRRKLWHVRKHNGCANVESAIVHALIVGGSGGVGGALVARLMADPAVSHVTVWQRRGADVSVRAKCTTQQIDLCDEATIAAAAQALGEVDLVIVATGLLHDDTANIRPEKTWRAIDPDAMRRSFEINTIGPALIAKHVLPGLPRDRRAVFSVLSARVGSISDNRLGGWYSYRASKAALNQIIRCLAIELSAKRPHAICVGLHPGTVDTALSKPFQSNVAEGRLFAADQSAAHLLDVIARLKPEQSGRLFDWAGNEIAP
jgi:NAD(P)-dependent dehydrogenase (short-subunit alcohol dehydrogenase family)